MEALTLSSPMAIIVVGLPGAGKSFFAKQFAATFGSALVSEDKIRWTLFAKHTYSKEENAMVQQVANLLIDELIRTKRTFILDGGYNGSAERTEIENRAHRAGFSTLIIDVQTDEPTCIRRATKRDSKKVGDQYKQSLTKEQFEQAKREFNEPITSLPNVVVISGKHTYKTQAKMVLRKMLEMGASAEPEDKPAKATTVQQVAQPRAAIDLSMHHSNSPFVR